jgi:hypothetical protein
MNSTVRAGSAGGVWPCARAETADTTTNSAIAAQCDLQTT